MTAGGGAAGTAGAVGATVSGRDTDAAGRTSALPSWLATMFVVPAATMVTTLPETVATAGLVLAYATGRPEEAVAPIVSGALDVRTLRRASKLTARAAPLPLVPTPEPRVSPPTVTCGSAVVAASGDG